MALKYTPVRRTILSGPDKGKEKTFAVVSHSYKLEYSSFLHRVAMRSRLHETDIKRVIEEIRNVLRSELKEGALIQFGEIGSFKLTILTHGKDTGQEFSRKDIRDIKVRFIPAKSLCPDIHQINFKRDDKDLK